MSPIGLWPRSFGRGGTVRDRPALRRAERAHPTRRQGAGFGVPAPGQIPGPLTAAAPDDGDLAVDVKDLQHAADVPIPVPAVLIPTVARPVLEVAREERPTLLKLAQDVAAELCVLLQELTPPPVPGVVRRAAGSPHPGADQRERLARLDERGGRGERA